MSATLSKRRRILEVYQTRVQAIAQVDGFHTDAGREVFVGEIPGLGPDDPDDAIAIVSGPDEWRQQGKGFLITWPVTIWAVTKADREAAYLALENILADIQGAVELADMTFGGLLHDYLVRVPPRVTLEREEGSLVVGVGVTYGNYFEEGWGQP